METPRAIRTFPSTPWLVLGTAVAVLAALSILTVDRPLAEALAPYEPWSGWDRGIALLEWPIGLPIHPLLMPVALCVGMLVAVAVPRFRASAPAWMFAAAVTLLGRFATGHIKELTGRLRPWQWLRHGGGDAPTFFERGISFPSGHVALFGCAAAILAVLVPRLRVPAAILVGFVMVARIAVGMHFLSDTLAAIAEVALLVGACGAAIRPLRPA